MPAIRNLVRLGALIATAGILTAATLWFLQSEPVQTPEIPSGAEASGGAARFGPGTWTKPVTSSSDNRFADLGTPPDGLATSSNHQLIVNQALRDVMDFFLLSGKGSDRAAHANALREHLQSKLPAPANQEATQIVDHYLSYMDAHDELLARQSLSPSIAAPGAQDVERLLSWQEQRARLRQSLLGMQVAQAWYQDEDAQLRQILTTKRGDASTSATQEFETLSDHMRSNREQAWRERDSQEILANAGKSFQNLIQDARKKEMSR